MLKIEHIGKLHTNTFRVGNHKHQLWEAVYYTQGEGLLQVEDETVAFHEGDVFLLPPGVVHSDSAQHGFQDIFFTFYRFGRTGRKYYHFRDAESRAILQVLNQMYDAFIRNDANREIIINLLYDLFFQYLCAWDYPSQDNLYASAIRTAILQNFSDPYFSVADTIHKLHINRNYARALFVQTYACTPLQFLKETRMEYAKKLLLSRTLSNYSIQEIALMSGHSDPYYFSRTFRKYTGLSPRDWEKQQSTKRKLEN